MNSIGIFLKGLDAACERTEPRSEEDFHAWLQRCIFRAMVLQSIYEAARRSNEEN